MMLRFLRIFGIVSLLGLLVPLLASADATTLGFEVNASAINSGQSVTLTWRTVNSSGAVIQLPCVSGVKYKDQNGAALACDAKIVSSDVAGGMVITVVNTSGSLSNIAPTLTPKNPDGSESLSGRASVSFSVATHPNPILDFSISTTTIVAGDQFTLSWSAPDVDRLNITIYCPDELMPTMVGDSRPRVPCNQQPIFLQDVTGSGFQAFTVTSNSLEAASMTFRLAPKIASGAYDGTHAKSLEVSIKPRPPRRDPVITSFRMGGQSLKEGQETSVTWSVEYGPGANLKMTCPGGVTATTSLTGSAAVPCNSFIFSSLLAGNGTFRMAFQNPSQRWQELELTLVPAISATEYDAVRSRSLRVTLVGDFYSSAVPAAPSPAPAVLQTPAPVPSPSASPVASSPKLGRILSKSIAYGTRNSEEVKLLQELLKKERIFEGDATGNFFSVTREAVRRFQVKYGIPAIGLAGPQTVAKLNEVTSGALSVPTSAVLPSPAASVPGSGSQVTANLRIGSRGNQVTLLQKILASDPDVYPNGLVSGYFGSATEAAVRRFQAKHGLDTVGFVGPGTRKKLNEIAAAKGIR